MADGLRDIVQNLSKSQLAKRDLFGRTLVHLAVTSGNVSLLSQLVSSDRSASDALTLADYENGYTPLHRAFLDGNMSCANILLSTREAAALVQAVDREKLSPFDLMEASLNCKLREWNPLSGGTELFTFGSNANHTLGFMDPDNRTFPEMVKLPRFDGNSTNPRTAFRQTRICDIKLAKQHSAILTDNPAGNLLTCGVATGGRLGLGQQTSTQFAFTPVASFRNERVTSISLGQDHTVAITAEGECYTWGSNKFSQLGYSGERQAHPRKVTGELKKTRLTGCAASRIHTVAFNSTELYCWGSNAGHLGFSSPDREVNAPRLVPHLPGAIVDVCATEIATVILCENHDVWVFMNGDRYRIPLPLNHTIDNFDAFRPRSAHIPSYTVKIACRGSRVCALTNTGSVYTFDLERIRGENVRAAHIPKLLRFNLSWVGKIAQKRARDVDIAEDGSLILSTECGYVYRRSGKKGSSHKFERIPYINRIQRVACDPIFGSFASIRQDVDLDAIKIRPSVLGEDMHYLLPYVDYSSVRKVEQLLRGSAPSGRPVRFTDRHDAEARMEEADDDEESDEEIEDHVDSNFQSSLLCQSLIRWLRSMTRDSLTMRLVPDDSRGYDYAIKDDKSKVDIPVHKGILACRSAGLFKLINGQEGSIELAAKGRVYAKADGLHFEDVELESIVILLYYLYTDNIVAVWDTFAAYSEPKVISTAKSQLLDICKALGLEHLRASIHRRQPPYPTLHHDLLALIDTQGDVKIMLKDGNIRAHSFVLKARSSYFATLLSESWAAGRTDLDQKDTTKATFAVALKHIYGDAQNDLFADFPIDEKTTTKDFVTFVLDVLRLADELSLLKLKEACESVLVDFVTVKNAGWLLGHAVELHASQLQDRILFYICHNVVCILENGFVGALTPDLFALIDRAMKGYLRRDFYWHDSSGKQLELFVQDMEELNDSLSRKVPVFGTRDQRNAGAITTASSTSSARRKSFTPHNVPLANGLDGSAISHGSPKTTVVERGFVVDNGDTNSQSTPVRRTSWASKGRMSGLFTSPSNENENSKWELVSSSKASTPSQKSPVLRPSSAGKSPPVRASNMLSNNSPSSSSWQPSSFGKRRQSSTGQRVAPMAPNANYHQAKKTTPTKAQPEEYTSVFATDEDYAASSSSTPASTTISLGEIMAESKNTGQGTSKGKVIGTPKLSQKERKKLQRQGSTAEPENNGSAWGTSSSPWGNPQAPSKSSPWDKAKAQGKAPVRAPANTGAKIESSNSDPFAQYRNKQSQKPSKSPKAAVGLADIMQQEHWHVQQKNVQSSKTLKEIQQEEEFERWWAQESAKIQQSMKQEVEPPRRRPRKKHGHNQAMTVEQRQ
uniref:ARAD1A04752p n=1 Tax=Blastobotrys adeninivorans TaxID=409370 RepID=A0A060SXL1_BLAAD